MKERRILIRQKEMDNKGSVRKEEEMDENAVDKRTQFNRC